MSEIPTSEEWALAQALKLRDYELEELELGVKTYNALTKAGVRTIGDLIIMSEEELDEIPLIGPRTIADVKEVLSWDGLTLGMHLPDELAYRPGRRNMRPPQKEIDAAGHRW